MIKAVIFDCFGVLVGEGWIPFKTRHFAHDKQLMDRAIELNNQANAGLIDFGELEAEVAKMTNLPLQEVQKQINDNPPNETLFKYINELKEQYKIGMLSNAADDWLTGLIGTKRLELFDTTVLSYATGVSKPQPEAYQLVADRLGVDPADCIFVDDLERYCTAAKEVGMHTVWYRDAEQAIGDIKKLLADSKQ